MESKKKKEEYGPMDADNKSRLFAERFSFIYTAAQFQSRLQLANTTLVILK